MLFGFLAESAEEKKERRDAVFGRRHVFLICRME